MQLEIFDVEHGQCSLVTSDAGAHMLIDAGHNVSTRWRPSEMLLARGIRTVDRLVVTNFDEDHVSDLKAVANVANIRALTRNRSVGSAQLLELKGVDHPGGGMATLVGMLDTYVHPITDAPDFGKMKFQTFWNQYPSDFEDENNLSVLLVLGWPEFTIAFTGDLESDGWAKLLERPDVRSALQPVNIFVASHLGRLNGFHSDVFDRTGMKPAFTVISDSGIDYESQRTGPLYRERSSGYNYNGEFRRVFTTRRDGTITMTFGNGGFSLSTSKRGPRLF